MAHRRTMITVALICGLAATSAVIVLMAGPSTPVRADPGILYVAPGGDCGGAAPCFGNVQEAVDNASDGEVINVATGVYTGVHTRLAPSGYEGPSTITQVVFIT